MLRKLFNWINSKVDPWVRPFWRIEPVWLRNLLTWIGHGLVTCGLTEAGYKLGGFGPDWLAAVGALLGYAAGVFMYWYREFVMDTNHDPEKALDKFGDFAGPLVMGFAWLWFIAWRMFG